MKPYDRSNLDHADHLRNHCDDLHHRTEEVKRPGAVIPPPAERMMTMEIMLLTVILFMWVAVCISIIRGHDLLEDIRNELEENKND